MSLLERVRRTIERHRLLEPGQRVVVALSGGPDSMALLHALRALGQWSLAIAHLDHGLREESARDAAFVQRVARELDLPLYLRRLEVRPEGEGLEEAARRARYRFLEEARAHFGAHRVALGHTADDQAETVLLRLVRGCGLRGLGGMPPARGPFVRPLIEVTRQEVEAFLREVGASWVVDRSNLDVRFWRNRIRHRVLPELRALNPAVVETICRMAEVLREEEAQLEGLAAEAVGRLRRAPGQWEAEGLRTLPPALRRRALRMALAEVRGDLRGVGLGHIRDLEELLWSDRPRWLCLPRARAVVRYGRLEIHPAGRPEPAPSFRYLIESLPARLPIPEVGRTLELQPVEPPPRPEAEPPGVGLLDLDRLRLPLEVRSPRPGDRLQPLGLQGTKKLQDFLVDRKVPREERSRVVLLLSEGRIVWVGGQEVAHPVRITPYTRRALRARLL